MKLCLLIFVASKNKISKRGSSYLRKALYQATVAGINNLPGGPHNKILYEFYSKNMNSRQKLYLLAWWSYYIANQ
ncbi:transposase [Dehalobacter sp. 14DCB1]|uniref:transposase n=1 Tax=unclassified Dehalobacter TaxID=2635733 RepID=UPI000E6BDD87|nr:transposase [Dehalobacter sp. 14DCB1]